VISPAKEGGGETHLGQLKNVLPPVDDLYVARPYELHNVTRPKPESDAVKLFQ
jgi:hypothetical protein